MDGPYNKFHSFSLVSASQFVLSFYLASWDAVGVRAAPSNARSFFKVFLHP